MGRSILAVIGGYAVMATAVIALFVLWFQEPSTEPTVGLMVLSLGYGFIFAIVGGYVTGLIAKRSEIQHVIALAAFGWSWALFQWWQLQEKSLSGTRSQTFYLWCPG